MSQIKEKEPYVISLYESGCTISQICELAKISNGSVYKILNINKIPLNRKRLYSVADDFFETINTIEKAYILGFIIADGHNNIPKNLLSIQLHPQDTDILEKINTAMGSTNPIHFYQYGKTKKACLGINSKQICSDLLNLGITKNKTYDVIIPKITPELLKYLVLGIFDGDGSISIDNSRYNKGNLTITGTKEIIQAISELIKTECDVNTYIYERHKERNNNNYTLSICGNLQIIRLLDWLYADSTIFLIRKYEKYIQLKKIVTDRLDKLEDKEIQKIKLTKQKEETILKKEQIILELYSNNLSIRQIKEETGIDRRYISKIIKKNEIYIRDKSAYEDYRVEKIKEYYNK